MTRSLPLVEFIAAFGDDPGVLPDGLVLGSSRTDWARIIKVINDNGWEAVWHDNARAVVSGDLSDSSRDGQTFALRPSSGILINFFFGGEEILFDIDLREFTHQDVLDQLCAVIIQFGSVLDMPVALSSEGDYDDVVLRYDPISNEFLVNERT